MVLEYSGGGPEAYHGAVMGDREEADQGTEARAEVGRIVGAAVEVADAEGLAALSMRRVADRLGIGTMSLYTYVPGKAELIDVMLDTVLGEVAESGM